MEKEKDDYNIITRRKNMMKNIIGKVLKSIPIALVVVSFAASIYAANAGLIAGYGSTGVSD